jgi:hypothetical protein
MYVSTPLGTSFHTHQKCPLTEMFFPVASLFNGLQAMFSLVFVLTDTVSGVPEVFRILLVSNSCKIPIISNSY